MTVEEILGWMIAVQIGAIAALYIALFYIDQTLNKIVDELRRRKE